MRLTMQRKNTHTQGTKVAWLKKFDIQQLMIAYRIIKDFYIAQEDISRRPRIFGMTASPVDAKEDVVNAARYQLEQLLSLHRWRPLRDLENLLHCKISTTSDLSLLRKVISRPQEEVTVFPQLQLPFETSWHQELKSDFGDIEAFRRLFERSKEVSSQLGRWCSDAYWTIALADEQARKFEIRGQYAALPTKETHLLEKIDSDISRLRDAARVVARHDLGVPRPELSDLSTKVLKLHDLLNLYFELPTDARCIVFVERRYTSHLLYKLFTHIGTPNLRPGVLVGVRGGEGDPNYTLRTQFLMLAKFRKGELNCLVRIPRIWKASRFLSDLLVCNICSRRRVGHTWLQSYRSVSTLQWMYEGITATA
jgi:endoribonuclease Dicer